MYLKQISESPIAGPATITTGRGSLSLQRVPACATVLGDCGRASHARPLLKLTRTDARLVTAHRSIMSILGQSSVHSLVTSIVELIDVPGAL